MTINLQTNIWSINLVQFTYQLHHGTYYLFFIMPAAAMTFEPSSIKDIQLYCKDVAFDNVEIKFSDFEYRRVPSGHHDMKLLPIIIMLDGVQVFGDIWKYENAPEMGFTLYDVQDFDMKYDLTATGECRCQRCQTFKVIGENKGADLKGRVTETFFRSAANERKNITSYSTCKIPLEHPRPISNMKGTISFKITLRKQTENSQLALTSFFCKDAVENLNQEKNFVMKCDGQEFHFNKTLLCMVSDVFRRMIQGKLGTESQNGFVEIVDFSPDTIRAFQKIVFENKDLDPHDPMIDLMMFADKYFMIPLKQKCIKGLVKNLSPNNVYEVTKIAAQIQDDDLIKTCAKFLSKNKISMKNN